MTANRRRLEQSWKFKLHSLARIGINQYDCVILHEYYLNNIALSCSTSFSFKFAGYLLSEVNFSGKEISFILKNKMATAGISLKIIHLFTPQPLRAVRVLFSPMVSGLLGGQTGRQVGGGKSLSSLYLRSCKV